MKRGDEWKKYIKDAKNRLNQSNFLPKEEEVYFLNSKKLSKHEVLKMSNIVSEILACEDFVADPLGKLIDKDEYDKLSEESKTKYLLDLSAIYLTLRSKIKKKA